MKSFIKLTICFAFFTAKASGFTSLTAKDVSVLYNSASQESKDLALYYASKRNIAISRLIGIKMPSEDQISRDSYQSLIPKIRQAIERQTTSPKSIVCMKGVPFGIKRTGQINNEASFDSELSLILHNVTSKGAIKNPFFKAKVDFSTWRKLQAKNSLKPILVCRIDAPTLTTCKRMIDDAISTEKTGLWGMTYLDLSKKKGNALIGDQWLNQIESLNWANGLPTVKDRKAQTFTTNYPMKDAALYFGWYTTHRNGPFLDKHFKFKKGAVACHIHSFSAQQLRNPNARWVGPLLEKGATAVLGNVYEPSLQLTTYLSIFHAQLIAGYTFAEAAYMATPALSWQTVMLGDPLYRPFKHLDDASGTITDEDKIYRITNIYWKLESQNEPNRIRKLRSAAAKLNSSQLYEIIGLWSLYKEKYKTSRLFFNSAIFSATNPSDKLRNALHQSTLMQTINQPAQAKEILAKAILDFKDSPHLQAAKSELQILNPTGPKK